MNNWVFKEYTDSEDNTKIGAIRKNIFLGAIDGNDWLETNYEGYLARGGQVEVVDYPNLLFPQVVLPTLSEVKEQKIVYIDSKTQELIALGFDFDDEKFSMSSNAQRNWAALGAAHANGLLSFPMTISTVDEGSFIINNSTHILQFMGAYLLYQTDSNMPLGKGRILKAQVENCTTIEQVNAIVDDR